MFNNIKYYKYNKFNINISNILNNFHTMKPIINKIDRDFDKKSIKINCIKRNYFSIT